MHPRSEPLRGVSGSQPRWPGRQIEATATSLPAGKEGCVNWQEERGMGASGAVPGSRRCTVLTSATVETARPKPGYRA